MYTNKPKIAAINLHLTNKCNMHCKYCFARFNGIENSMNLKETIYLMEELREYGFDKINFVGGEPLLIPNLKDLIKKSSDLGFFTSIVTNGTLINEKFINNIYPYINQIGLSIDSLNTANNHLIGRETRNMVANIEWYRRIISIIKSYDIDLKINTVVSQINKNEIIADRWKVFQVLLVAEENSNEISDFLISEDEFNNFCDSNSTKLNNSSIMVKESNSVMQGSYIMVNPQGHFFDNTKGKYTVSEKVTEIGIEKALQQIQFDRQKFNIRNGNYYQFKLNQAV
jgi:radical S-adenosyl methionine domain-containing protein 2